MGKTDARTITHIEADGAKTVTTYWPKKHWWNPLEEPLRREKILYKSDGTILEGFFHKNGTPSIVTAFKDDKNTIMMRFTYDEQGVMQRIESGFVDNVSLCYSEYSPQEGKFILNDAAFIAHIKQSNASQP